MKLFIKNMVCRRCIMAVQSEAEKLGIEVKTISLGELETVQEEVDADVLQRFDEQLRAMGFERFDDRRSRLIQTVKSLVIEKIHHSDEEMTQNWSGWLSSRLPYEYNYISKLFSSAEGITLEQFIIRQKVEKVKELLLYEELTLDEIAWKLGYSSAAYLSNQFKKVTGMTPGQFRSLLNKDRKPLDKI